MSVITNQNNTPIIKTDGTIRVIYDPQNLLNLTNKNQSNEQEMSSLEKRIFDSIISIYSGVLPGQTNIDLLKRWATDNKNQRLSEKINEVCNF